MSETDSLLPSGPSEVEKLQKRLFILSIAYMLTIGVSGLVLSAMGTNLDDIARKIGAEATVLGGIAFMVKGIGSICASLVSTKIFEMFNGDNVLCIGLSAIASFTFLLPFISTVYQLYFSYFFLGFFSSLNDTGCNILARKKHGTSAGPWLAANGIAFGSSAAIVPIVGLMSSSFIAQYVIMGLMILCVAAFLFYSSTLISGVLDADDRRIILKIEEEIQRNREDQKEVDEIAPHHYVEMVISAMVFCICGIQVATCSYLVTYLREKNLVQGDMAHNVPLVFWVFWSMGRILGVLDQRRTLSDSVIAFHLSTCLLLGSMGVALLYVFASNAIIVSISIALFALFHGPTNGYCLDLNNRLTLPTEKSTSIIMVGINCGDSLVPYITSAVWRVNGENPITLVHFMFGCMFVPFILTQFIEPLSYKKSMDDFTHKRDKTSYYYQAFISVYEATSRYTKRMSIVITDVMNTTPVLAGRRGAFGSFSSLNSSHQTTRKHSASMSHPKKHRAQSHGHNGNGHNGHNGNGSNGLPPDFSIARDEAVAVVKV